MQRLCDAHDMNNECDGSILTFNFSIGFTFVSSKSYAYIKLHPAIVRLFNLLWSADYIKLMITFNIFIQRSIRISIRLKKTQTAEDKVGYYCGRYLESKNIARLMGIGLMI